jgi:hypothetical protein
MFVLAHSAAGVIMTPLAYRCAGGLVLLACTFNWAFTSQRVASLEDWGRPVMMLQVWKEVWNADESVTGLWGGTAPTCRSALQPGGLGPISHAPAGCRHARGPGSVTGLGVPRVSRHDVSLCSPTSYFKPRPCTLPVAHRAIWTGRSSGSTRCTTPPRPPSARPSLDQRERPPYHPKGQRGLVK